MLKTVLLSLSGVVVVGIAVVLILAARKPDSFQVTRTATINAPPERVYALIADFKAWSAWSPWEKKDPAMKRTYGGAETGVGATYARADALPRQDHACLLRHGSHGRRRF